MLPSLRRWILTVAAAVLAAEWVDPGPGRAATVVLANHAGAKVHFTVVPPGGRPEPRNIAAGDVLSLPAEGELGIAFESEGRPRRYLVPADSIQYFVRRDGRLDLTQLALPAVEQNAQPRAAPAQAPGGTVSIPVKILVDQHEPAVRQVWEQRLRDRLQEASAVFARCCRVRFEVVAVDTWRSDDANVDVAEALSDFESRVRPAPARLAIGLSSYAKLPGGPVPVTATPGPLHSHILVREGANRAGRVELLRILIHELGHFLGAVHSAEEDSVMRPVLRDPRANGRDFRLGFDPLNTLAMNLFVDDMRSRPVRALADVRPETKARLRGVYKVLEELLPNDRLAQNYVTLLDPPDASPMAAAAAAQPRPYIGFAYPAGGQQGTTLAIRLGGQNLNDVHTALVTGTGVAARVIEFFKRLDGQEIALLREQLAELKREPPERAGAAAPRIARIERRLAETVNAPACPAIATLVMVEVTIAADAAPGPREIRLVTPRGVTNPLVFHVGQLPEVCRKPMLSATQQVLGKEELALRKRPDDEIEQRIVVPCVVNGQIASGEVNRYRFAARQGQRLVISTAARQLIPYIADAVPGWFQPALTLRGVDGKEVACHGDYRSYPDPVFLCQVPHDGQYVLDVTDAVYRGREDFVYRITIGELPWVTGIFPLGGRIGLPPAIDLRGWNLAGATLTRPASDAGPGIHMLTASNREGAVSNRVPFALDTLPECLEQEPNDDLAHAQQVTLPVVINGRIGHPGDWDVFRCAGRAGQQIVAEVQARRLDSPLDSVLKLTDAHGKVLAFNDDHEDPSAGLNTHHADSYILAALPADGVYYVHLGDVAQQGGEEYGYRLRLSAPRPDFALRVVPSSVGLRGKSTATVNVFAVRKDGFDDAIRLSLKDPPAGFSAAPAILPANQSWTRLTIKTSVAATKEPVHLTIVGQAFLGEPAIVREAVPAEDRMQAFLWRHLVPAADFQILVFDPASEPPPKRRRSPAAIEAATKAQAEATAKAEAEAAAKPDVPPARPKFTEGQVAGRLRQIRFLFEEGLLTDEFNERKIAELAVSP